MFIHNPKKNLPISLLQAALAGLIIASLFFTPAIAAETQDVPRFEPSACMFPLPQGVSEGVDVQCGYLTVPLEHANPSGPTIQLAVAIIKSKEASPKPDPLVMAQGGPGGSTIDTYAEPLLTRSSLRADRDIILFDQRGTLYSRPALMCKEIDQLTLDTLDEDLSLEEGARLSLQATQECRERLAGEGLDLSPFNSLENAADIEDLRVALGYEQINLYGVSYGTMLAQHTMRLFPEGLRSVILDGVVPLQTNFILEVPKTMDRSFTHLFQSCASDPACNKEFPDLEKVFFEVVDKLNQTPATVPMKDPETYLTHDALIDGDSFQSGLFQLLYVSSIIPALPRMIYDAQKGNFDFFTTILAIIIFDKTSAYGMYYSVLCAEDADYNADEVNLSGIRPQIAEIEGRGPQDMLDVCKMWAVEPLDASVDQPISSDIPTLLLSGAFDPITPPEFAQSVAANLSKSYSVTFPTGSHGQAMEGGCQDHLILAFLENPNQQPDTRCISGISKTEFFTQESLIDLPVLAKLLNLDGSSIVELLLLVLSVTGLLTAWFIFPVAWLGQKLSRKPAPPQPVLSPADQIIVPVVEPSAVSTILPRLASWMAALNGSLLLIFLGGLFSVVFKMINDNDNRLFYGVPANAAGWFFLPTLSAGLTILMAAALAQAFSQRKWSWGKRIYYILLVLCGLVSLIILGLWGALAAWI
ncbi:MAG: alpha/beta fold hydrolase [Anaerolineales bacterium]|nr:alpha/beta fold hydrolase [Anaerolineales bacterium]